MKKALLLFFLMFTTLLTAEKVNQFIDFTLNYKAVANPSGDLLVLVFEEEIVLCSVPLQSVITRIPFRGGANDIDLTDQYLYLLLGENIYVFSLPFLSFESSYPVAGRHHFDGAVVLKEGLYIPDESLYLSPKGVFEIPVFKNSFPVHFSRSLLFFPSETPRFYDFLTKEEVNISFPDIIKSCDGYYLTEKVVLGYDSKNNLIHVVLKQGEHWNLHKTISVENKGLWKKFFYERDMHRIIITLLDIPGLQLPSLIDERSDFKNIIETRLPDTGYKGAEYFNTFNYDFELPFNNDLVVKKGNEYRILISPDESDTYKKEKGIKGGYKHWKPIEDVTKQCQLVSSDDEKSVLAYRSVDGGTVEVDSSYEVLTKNGWVSALIQRDEFGIITSYGAVINNNFKLLVLEYEPGEEPGDFYELYPSYSYDHQLFPRVNEAQNFLIAPLNRHEIAIHFPGKKDHYTFMADGVKSSPSGELLLILSEDGDYPLYRLEEGTLKKISTFPRNLVYRIKNLRFIETSRGLRLVSHDNKYLYTYVPGETEPREVYDLYKAFGAKSLVKEYMKEPLFHDGQSVKIYVSSERSSGVAGFLNRGERYYILQNRGKGKMIITGTGVTGFISSEKATALDIIIPPFIKQIVNKSFHSGKKDLYHYWEEFKKVVKDENAASYRNSSSETPEQPYQYSASGPVVVQVAEGYIADRKGEVYEIFEGVKKLVFYEEPEEVILISSYKGKIREYNLEIREYIPQGDFMPQLLPERKALKSVNIPSSEQSVIAVKIHFRERGEYIAVWPVYSGFY